MKRRSAGLTLAVLLGLAGAAEMAAQASSGSPTAADAKAFVDGAEKTLLQLWITQSRADWVKSTYITDDTEILAAQAADKTIEASVQYAKDAVRFDKVAVPEETARKLKLLKLSLTMAAPSDPAERAELTRISTAMEGAYGKGKYCPTKDRCLDLEDITKIMATSRDARELLDVWAGWHAVGGPMKKDYVRFVELSNKGARELGFKDTGAMWRSKYDMTPEAFAAELDRLWEQVRPLYVSLHAYVRWKLRREVRRRRARRTGRSRRICSATCGRRPGTTSIRWSLRRTRIRATT